jgi:hypothetical protein
MLQGRPPALRLGHLWRQRDSGQDLLRRPVSPCLRMFMHVVTMLASPGLMLRMHPPWMLVLMQPIPSLLRSAGCPAVYFGRSSCR